MSNDNIINMANATGDGTLQSPKHALEDALKSIGEHGAFKSGKKLLILALDEGDGDEYSISFIQAGMRMSQCVALCEAAKTVFLDEMGY